MASLCAASLSGFGEREIPGSVHGDIGGGD